MQQTSRSARYVALVYLAVSAVWIATSDHLLLLLVPDPEAFARLQTVKGWFFVAASALLLWWLIRREMERARHSEGRFRTLAEQGIAGFYVVHRGRFVYCNERLAEVFGYSSDEVVGRPALELTAPEDRARVASAFQKDEQGDGGPVHHEFQGLRSDGDRVPVEVIGRRVVWEGRTCLAGVLVDVSERAGLERDLRQAMRVEAVGHLTGAVVHDFNNLLTGILGQLDLAILDLPPASPVRSELRIARQAASRGALLTTKLLAFTRTQVQRPRAIDPNEALRDMEGLLRGVKPSPVRLRLDLDPEAVAVLLDPSDFDQLVMNLYINALQAIQGEGDVRIATRRSGGRVAVEVRDTGGGMDERTLGRIFDPFFTTKERGTGLGLATVRRIVDEAGGRVEVHSRPEGGATTFCIWLPAAGAGAARVPAKRGAPAGEPDVAAASILVIDDDRMVRRVMKGALTRAGHRVSESADADSALAAVERDPGIELVIVDVSLPGMSGPELVERLLELRPHLRVIFTSGYAPADLKERQRVLDRHPFLAKPFSVEELMTVTAETLANPPDPGSAALA